MTSRYDIKSHIQESECGFLFFLNRVTILQEGKS